MNARERREILVSLDDLLRQTNEPREAFDRAVGRLARLAGWRYVPDLEGAPAVVRKVASSPREGFL